MKTKQEKEFAVKNLKNMGGFERVVSEELLHMGFSYKYTGTFYLRNAIMFAIKEKPGQYQTSRELIGRINTMVANKYGIRRDTAIMQMRLSIESAFTFGNIDYLLDIFKGVYDYEKGRVDNATFIMTVAEKIKQDAEEKQCFSATQLRILIQGEVENIKDIETLGSLYSIVHALEGGAIA